MKNFLKFLFIFSILFFVVSCGSTPKNDSSKSSDDEIEDINVTIDLSAEEDDDSYLEDSLQFDDDEVIDVEDVYQIDTDEEDEEYIRSTENLSGDETVTKEEFNDDKTEILRLIEELQDVMKKEDVNAWLKYIDKESIKYYSTPANIRKAQKKLPNKAIVLNGIGDYFKYVFIPSRKRSEVKEIRYISKTNIKAVDVKSDGTLIVYYQFVKVNNQWLVHIPTL